MPQVHLDSAPSLLVRLLPIARLADQALNSPCGALRDGCRVLVSPCGDNILLELSLKGCAGNAGIFTAHQLCSAVRLGSNTALCK